MEKVKCPNCKELAAWKNNPYRPFCSEACKSKDLGKWATEQYRIPQQERDSGLPVPEGSLPKKEED